MYTKMLITLDGSKTAEQVLPYARFLTSRFKKPAELITIVDIAEMMANVSAEKAVQVYEMVQEGVRSGEAYLKQIAQSFHDARVNCTVEKGRAAEVIIDAGETDTGMLITMATHGHSGLHRWLLGSVAEKVLRATANPVLLIRAKENGKSEGEASLKSLIVPLDGSELAESVLPLAAGLASKLDLDVILFRGYNTPYSVYGYGYGYFAIDVDKVTAEMKKDAHVYLEKKAAELKNLGIGKIACITREGNSADDIIKVARETPNSLIVMCGHGRSGVRRWVLGSVTETVVRHADNPVLVLRPAIPSDG
jgi:nucleotide-binding universal stress UspA family protein